MVLLIESLQFYLSLQLVKYFAGATETPLGAGQAASHSANNI